MPPKKSQDQLLAEREETAKLAALMGQSRALQRGDHAAADSRGEVPHKFWDTQPVPKLGPQHAAPTDFSDCGAIEPMRAPSDLATSPPALPDVLQWCDINIDNPTELNELYTLLCNHYVDDDESVFRFAYRRDFLRWALRPPGQFSSWLFGIRATGSKELVAFISGTPASVRSGGHIIQMAEVNFLCVHKDCRAKRLAPVLIKEITRRVQLTNRWQAVYTAGVVLPRPVGRCQYYHRSLNPEKLIAVKFSAIPLKYRSMKNPLLMTKQHFKVPDAPTLPGLRPMRMEDVPDVTKLLQRYLSKFHIAPVLEEDEVAHYFVPRGGIVYSFVIAKDSAGKPADGRVPVIPADTDGSAKKKKKKTKKKKPATAAGDAKDGAAAAKADDAEDDEGDDAEEEADPSAAPAAAAAAAAPAAKAERYPYRAGVVLDVPSYTIDNDDEQVAARLAEAARVRKDGIDTSDLSITDIFSFYIVPSTVSGHKTYDSLTAAYSFYHVATSVTLEALLGDALVVAKNVGCDVFNALDHMDNASVVQNLKFGVGDGALQYYLYNWKTVDLQTSAMGLVLL